MEVSNGTKVILVDIEGIDKGYWFEDYINTVFIVRKNKDDKEDRHSFTIDVSHMADALWAIGWEDYSYGDGKYWNVPAKCFILENVI